MPPLFVTTHIHTDGPIPGPHSLLTLISAAQPCDGDPTSTFGANVRELPGATLHPGALQRWQRRPEDWLASRRASRPPAAAMNAYLRWVEDSPASRCSSPTPPVPTTCSSTGTCSVSPGAGRSPAP